MIYRPYSSNGGVPPSGNASNVQQTAGLAPSTLLMSSFISRLPFAYQIIDSMVRNNPKFYSFKNQTSLKDQMLEDQSVFMSQPEFPTGAAGSFSINKDYQAFIYASIDKDKGRRIMDYRRMAAYAELADCLDEICDECIVKNDGGDIVRFKLVGSFSKTVQDEISTEFKKFIEIYDLENTGWEKFRQLLIEGELFYENLIKEGKEDYGIIGLMSIPSDLINPVFHNVQNELLKGFLLQKPVMGNVDSTTSPEQQQLLFLQKAQVSYINSGIWNEFKTFRLPFIENCKRAYRQLSLIEDSVVIYRLVRAPERLVFKVYTGNMPQPKAESYIKSMMMKYWSKKTYNGVEQRVSNVYDPQSMLDSYWFPKDAQGNGTDVQPLNTGAGNLGEIKDLDYFLTKLYKSLKVPVSRFMTAGDAFKDGAEITRDELRFARFIMRLQTQFSIGIKDTFVTHLKLKGLWKDYKLKDQAIKINFNEPTSFMAMRNQQLLKIKFDNFAAATQGDSIAKSYAQKYYLEMSADEMKENRDWLRVDAALKWELGQIEQSGPDFRKQIAAQQAGSGGGGEAPTSGGMDMGGGGAPGAGEIPDFGSGGGESSPPPEAPIEPAGGAPESPSAPEPPPA